MADLVRVERAPERNAGDQIAVRADDDLQLIALWMSTKQNAGTADQYQRVLLQFFELVNLPIRSITLNDMIAYAKSIEELRPATQARKIATIKSLFTFAHKVGYTRVNVAATLRAPKGKDALNERILTEEQILRMILSAGSLRNECLMRMLYRSAGRISEVITATWSDLVRKEKAGQVTFFGKGGKTRTVQLPLDLMYKLEELRAGSVESQDGDRIFPITRHHAWQLIKQIAKRAGVTDKVSPHWIRHAHATHALDHDAPLKLVSSTLGHSSLAITDRYLHNRPDESSGDFLTVG